MARRRRIFRRKRKSGAGDAGPEQEERTEGRSRADTGEILDRLGDNMPERDPAPTVVVSRSSEEPEPEPDEEHDDTTERIRIAADEAVRAAEERSLDEILALEKDVESARSEAGELREQLEEAERRAAEAESRADEARARPPEPEPAAIDVESPGAAERLAAALSARDRELEEERRSKTEAIERADRRLAEIEEQARAAAERIDAAEQRLADDAEGLRADAEERVRRQAEEADRRADEGIAKAEEAVAAAEQRAGRETEERIRSEEQERARAEAQRLESEVRSAAADWLRKQTKALRREGRREAETKLETELAAARRQLAATRKELEREREQGFRGVEGRLDKVQEQAGDAEQSARSAAISDTHEWKAAGLQEPPNSTQDDEPEDQPKPGQ
jgi:hypothetical protein